MNGLPLVRHLRRILTGLGYVLVAALPLLLAVVVAVAGLVAQNPLGGAPAYAGAFPEPPAHDPTRPTAVVVAGHTATSHHTTLQMVEKSHPEVNWVRGVR